MKKHTELEMQVSIGCQMTKKDKNALEEAVTDDQI